MDESFAADLRQAWRHRLEQKKRVEDQRRQLAVERAWAAASVLREKYGAKKVFLYGSLAWGPSFDERSDIDLMVEGLPDQAGYWRMLAEVGDVVRPFEISVVRQEDAFESLRKKVQETGVLL